MSKFRSIAGIGAAGGIIDAATEVLEVDVRDLTAVSLIVTQVTDAGTATLNVEVTADGVDWAPFGAALTEASFAAANLVSAAPIPLQGATNGMPLYFAKARVRASALAGGGVYRLTASGIQRDNPR